jgi:hypothetical protein
LGHSSVETTMIHTHVLDSGRCPVRSPLDLLTAAKLPVIGGESLPSITAIVPPTPIAQCLPLHGVGEKKVAPASPR